jgi:hypothetical protein
MYYRAVLRSALAVLSVCAFCGVLAAAPVFTSSSYAAALTFNDALSGTTMTMAWDGTNYWSCTGGSSGGTREARYSPAGAILNTYSPGLDFRSMFSDGSGNLYARQYHNQTIYKQTSPGVFASYATLGSTTAGDPDQVGVFLNGAGTEYVAQDSGVIYRWNLSGTLLGTITLTGYGAVSGETSYPQNVRMTPFGAYYLTYANQILSAWDASGNRVDQTTLTGAGSSGDSYWSISYANGYAWVVDSAGGLWRGYQIGTPSAPPPPATVPVLSPWGLGILGAMLLGFAAWFLRTRSLARA